ncbi:unnamed protein product [Caenorhabditis nigoni]
MPTPQASGITKKEALAIIQRCKARASTSSRRAQGTHFTEFQYSVLQARFAVKPAPKAREQSALAGAIGMTPKQAEDWFKHAAKKKKKFPKTKDKAIMAILRVAKKESGRMPYTLLSLKNRAVLCAWFEISDRISAQEQVELGKELGIRALSIQYWFNSRRKKVRNGIAVEEAVYDPEDDEEEEDEDEEEEQEQEDQDEQDHADFDDPEDQDSTDSEADHDEEGQEDRDPMEDTEDELEEREGQDHMNSEDDEDRRTDNLQEESEAQGEQDPMEDTEDDLESPEAQDQDPMEDDDLEEPEAHNPMDSEDEDAPEEPVVDEDAPENPEDPDADQDALADPEDAPENPEDPDADQNAPVQPIPDQAPDFYNNQWHEIPEEDQDSQFGRHAPDNEDEDQEDRPDRFREGRELPRGLDEHQMAYQNDLFMDF